MSRTNTSETRKTLTKGLPGLIISDAQVKDQLRHGGKAEVADNRAPREKRGGNWAERV
jgi:hypothetical protein